MSEVTQNSEWVKFPMDSWQILQSLAQQTSQLLRYNCIVYSNIISLYLPARWWSALPSVSVPYFYWMQLNIKGNSRPPKQLIENPPLAYQVHKREKSFCLSMLPPSCYCPRTTPANISLFFFSRPNLIYKVPSWADEKLLRLQFPKYFQLTVQIYIPRFASIRCPSALVNSINYNSELEFEWSLIGLYYLTSLRTCQVSTYNSGE